MFLLIKAKSRSKFKPDKTKTETHILRSTKFLKYIINSKRQNEENSSIVAKQINRIIDCLEGNYVCNTTLYMISNEAKRFEEKTNKYIDILQSSYGMKVVNI